MCQTAAGIFSISKSGVSDRATILVICQRPPKCHKCDDGLKVFSPRPQSDNLHSSLYNVWNRSVNCDLPVNSTNCNYIAIGRASPLQLSRSTGSSGDSIQVATVVKDLGVFMDNFFSLSIHCEKVASKPRRMLFLIRRSFAELSVSAFAAFYNTLVQSHLRNALQDCLPNPAAVADCL